MRFRMLQADVLRWANDKDLLHIKNAPKQFMKFIEEVFEFKTEMEKQKNRSRNAASQELSDWTFVSEEMDSQFVGYDATSTDVHILRYRQVKQKKKSFSCNYHRS